MLGIDSRPCGFWDGWGACLGRSLVWDRGVGWCLRVWVDLDVCGLVLGLLFGGCGGGFAWGWLHSC